VIIRDLHIQNYQTAWQNMLSFVDTRNENSADEMWLLEHEPVFTLGVAGVEAHILQNPSKIPVVRSDRGGQVTYHGPGQLIIYPLINLARHKLSVKEYVTSLEQMVIDLLQEFAIDAQRNPQMPGVYVNNAKIASIGIRVRRDWALHGVSLNVNMDLAPFDWINPCGIAQQKMVQIADFVPQVKVADIKHHMRQQNGLLLQI